MRDIANARLDIHDTLSATRFSLNYAPGDQQ